MLKTIVSLIASLITISVMRLAGRNDQRFNYLGLTNCLVWTFFTFITQAWGLFPLNFALAYIYSTNLRRNWPVPLRKHDELA